MEVCEVEVAYGKLSGPEVGMVKVAARQRVGGQGKKEVCAGR